MGITRNFDIADFYTMVPNAWLRDETLSWKARGILSHLMTHKAGWTISIEQLVKAAPDGRDSLRTGILELEAKGYLVRDRRRNEDGTLAGMDYQLIDPVSPSPTSGNPTVGKPTHKKTIKREEQEIEEQDNEPRERGRATESQVKYLMDMHRAGAGSFGGALSEQAIRAHFESMTITEADAEIRAARRARRASPSF